MSECTHDCSACGEACARRDKSSFLEKPHELSKIKKVIGVVSGKGGVGKSSVTAMLSVLMRRKGKECAVLDADITGPSIPRMFGVKGMLESDGANMFPATSRTGIRMVSANLLLPNETEPVIYRGPMLAGLVKDFWTGVIWGDVDYMFVDMPPGTGDVPLTVFQSLPLDGIIVVTSPQELVSMIVGKAVKMANMMNIPVIGVVENLSYVKCPCCGKEIDVFGEGKVDEVATEYHLKVLGRLPIDPNFAELCDAGKVEDAVITELDAAIGELLRI